MGHCEKFLYCDNAKDTKRFLDLMKKYKDNIFGFEVVSLTTFKRNYIMKHREIKGMEIGECKVPFNFVSPLELENQDKFYRADTNLPDDFDGLSIKTYYGEEEEKFFNKNEMLIWISGNRGNMADVYNMFGLDLDAINVMLLMEKDGAMEEDWLVDGRIDIEKLLPDAKRAVARKFFEPDEFELINKVKFIDLDGVEDIDSKLQDGSLFKHKRCKGV